MSYLFLALAPLLFAGGLWQINVIAAPEAATFDGLMDLGPSHLSS